MKQPYLYLFACLVSLSVASAAQDIHPLVQTMKTAYTGSGAIILTDDHTLVIEPNMPDPLCALPRTQNGQTEWSYYSFPLASITVPLTAIDDTLIGEDQVFTKPDAASAYKPGDAGDTTLVVIVGLPGKQFHTLTYDRDKFAALGPGPHNSSAYGQAPDDVMAFGLTFTNRDSARAFELALRKAVLLARSQTVAQARPPRQ